MKLSYPHFKRPSPVPARVGGEKRGLAAALVIGIALASVLWLGLIPVALRIYAERRSLAGSFDSRLVDLLGLGLNAALLVALFWLWPRSALSSASNKTASGPPWNRFRERDERPT